MYQSTVFVCRCSPSLPIPPLNLKYQVRTQEGTRNAQNSEALNKAMTSIASPTHKTHSRPLPNSYLADNARGARTARRSAGARHCLSGCAVCFVVLGGTAQPPSCLLVPQRSQSANLCAQRLQSRTCRFYMALHPRRVAGAATRALPAAQLAAGVAGPAHDPALD